MFCQTPYLQILISSRARLNQNDVLLYLDLAVTSQFITQVLPYRLWSLACSQARVETCHERRVWVWHERKRIFILVAIIKFVHHVVCKIEYKKLFTIKASLNFRMITLLHYFIGLFLFAWLIFRIENRLQIVQY